MPPCCGTFSDSIQHCYKSEDSYWETLISSFTSGLSATLPERPGDSAIWLDSDAIIDRRPNPLLAAKVSLGRLNRDMSQQELDLLQFAS